jgi:hypothetical protein
MFQGVGADENLHDLELAAYLEAVGLNDILRRHGYDPKDVVFPNVSDWVESPQPDICVDRVDYGLREMNRWNDVIYLLEFNADDFIITPDGRLAMEDQQRARVFAEGFLLLSQEHWSEPTHRFMEDMLILRTKLFYGQGGAPRSWVFKPEGEAGLIPLHEMHPRDLMYVTDPTQTEAYRLPNLAGHTIESIMSSVATYRRQYVWQGRRQRINQYLQQFSEPGSYNQIQSKGVYTPLESDQFKSYLDEYSPTLPAGFAILDPAEAEATKNDFCIDIPQPPFKMRQIDPLVKNGRGFRRLSEVDPSYAQRLSEHRARLNRQKVARLMIADPRTLDIVKTTIDNVEYYWRKRLETSRRMTPQELRSLIRVSASDVIGPYPFMTFQEY